MSEPTIVERATWQAPRRLPMVKIDPSVTVVGPVRRGDRVFGTYSRLAGVSS